MTHLDYMTGLLVLILSLIQRFSIKAAKGLVGCLMEVGIWKSKFPLQLFVWLEITVEILSTIFNFIYTISHFSTSSDQSYQQFPSKILSSQTITSTIFL